MHVWNIDPITRGLKLDLTELVIIEVEGNIDPITRGLNFTDRPVSFSSVWNIDPITRGLKQFGLGATQAEAGAFGILTRLLGA